MRRRAGLAHNPRVLRSIRESLPDPFATWPLPAPVITAQRSLSLFGAPVELVLLPDRAARRTASDAVLRSDRVTRILAEEALWRCPEPHAVLTPNRYPFAASASVLWSAKVGREAEPELVALALDLAERHGGTVLMNTIGAAATLPRAHLHLTAERLPFLAQLPCLPVSAAQLGVALGDASIVRLAPPFPGLVFGVRGDRVERARAASRLLELRAAPAVNLISDGETTWVAPRRLETPTPHFAAPLGCAELWGRFCYEDAAGFEAATATSLLAALAAALWPPLP